MNTRERLKSFLAYTGLSERAFEEKTGMAKGFVSKVGDSIRTSSLEKITMIYPDINTSWLLTGVGSMLKSQSGDDSLQNEIKRLRETNEKYEQYIEVLKEQVVKLMAIPGSEEKLNPQLVEFLIKELKLGGDKNKNESVEE